MRTVWVKVDVSKHFSRLVEKKSGGGGWSPRNTGMGGKIPEAGGAARILCFWTWPRESGENFVFKKCDLATL